jgi:hypothetical protein
MPIIGIIMGMPGVGDGSAGIGADTAGGAACGW